MSLKRLKHELEAEFGVPVYSKWAQVPKHLETKTELRGQGIAVAKAEKPHAIKNSYPSGYYFLFDKRKLTLGPDNLKP